MILSSEKSCERPAKPDNGRVNYSGRPGYPVGSTITYECDEDYELQGTILNSCSASGEWAYDTPACQKSECDCA